MLRAIRHFRQGKRARRVWQAGLHDEQHFWADWFRTKGLDWPDDYAHRLDPSSPLQPDIRARLADDATHPIRILDVGAGPLTALGKQIDGRPLDITAVDPLADEYDRLIAEAGIDPPVRTTRADAECLTDRFQPATFDLSYARNCLDHSYDPARAIRQMIAVTRPRCVVYLEHLINEAENEQYRGLHQWNFTTSDAGHFMLWQPALKIDLDDELADVASCRVERDGNWVRATLTKHAG